MLILSRRPDETIVIEGGIEIKVLSVKGKQVRIGINAPPDIAVHRKEIQDKIDHERLGTLSDALKQTAATT